MELPCATGDGGKWDGVRKQIRGTSMPLSPFLDLGQQRVRFSTWSQDDRRWAVSSLGVEMGWGLESRLPSVRLQVGM